MRYAVKEGKYDGEVYKTWAGEGVLIEARIYNDRPANYHVSVCATLQGDDEPFFVQQNRGFCTSRKDADWERSLMVTRAKEAVKNKGRTI